MRVQEIGQTQVCVNYAQVMHVLRATTYVREYADTKLPVEQILPPDKLLPHSRVHVLEHQVQASLAGSRTHADVAEVVYHPHDMSGGLLAKTFANASSFAASVEGYACLFTATTSPVHVSSAM